MEINSKLTSNELHKAGLLLVKAAELGMDVSGYGQLDVNKGSGNVYLWIEDYNFCLYIPMGSDWTVMACYSCPVDGEEETRKAGNSMPALEKWAEKLAAKSDKKQS